MSIYHISCSAHDFFMDTFVFFWIKVDLIFCRGGDDVRVYRSEMSGQAELIFWRIAIPNFVLFVLYTGIYGYYSHFTRRCYFNNNSFKLRRALRERARVWRYYYYYTRMIVVCIVDVSSLYDLRCRRLQSSGICVRTIEEYTPLHRRPSCMDIMGFFFFVYCTQRTRIITGEKYVRLGYVYSWRE